MEMKSYLRYHCYRRSVIIQDRCINAQILIRVNCNLNLLKLFYLSGVLYNGANGATLSELDQFIKMKENSMNESELREGFRYLSNSIMRKTSSKNDQLQLYMSNTVVAQTSLELKPEFQQSVKTYFKASVLIDNFGSPEVLAQTLNRIIKSQTNDKIDKMFDKNLDPHTQLMILNVVYFKGDSILSLLEC